MQKFSDINGYASISDLKNEEWRLTFDKLQNYQSEFLKLQKKFRSDGYKWPKDPLNEWSRIWEYPYVYRNIRKIIEKESKSTLEVLDYGSGVTFVPFALSKLGCNVTCADIDPVVGIDIPKAVEQIGVQTGSIGVALITNGKIPKENQSQDVVYCVSVLEHIQNFEIAIEEIYRVLKPNGTFILTFDVDLRGNFDLNTVAFNKLINILDRLFTNTHQERPVHPLDLLTTVSSPRNRINYSPLSLLKQIMKMILRNNHKYGDPRVDLHLCVYAGTYKKIENQKIT